MPLIKPTPGSSSPSPQQEQPEPIDTATALASLPTQTDRFAREQVLGALGADAVPGLFELIRLEDASLRNEVLDRLREMPSAVAPYLDEMLRDADPDVRILAVQLVSQLALDTAPQLLAGVLARDEHVNVAGAALDALAEVGDASIVPVVKQALARFNEPYLDFAADIVLRRLGA